jgi:hypothetical protein
MQSCGFGRDTGSGGDKVAFGFFGHCIGYVCTRVISKAEISYAGSSTQNEP